MPQFKVTASSLNVRQTPSLQGVIIGALAENNIVEQLDTSEDQKWLKVQKDALVGWSSQKYLTPFTLNAPTGSLDQIIQIASSSAIATYNWPERGIAPRGYTKGMALVFARVYCKLLDDLLSSGRGICGRRDKRDHLLATPNRRAALSTEKFQRSSRTSGPPHLLTP